MYFSFLRCYLKRLLHTTSPVNQYQGQEWTLLPSILLKKIQFDRRFWKGIITSAWLIEEVGSSDHDSFSHSLSKSGVLTLWIFFTFWLFVNSSSHVGLKTTYNVLLHMAMPTHGFMFHQLLLGCGPGLLSSRIRHCSWRRNEWLQK